MTRRLDNFLTSFQNQENEEFPDSVDITPQDRTVYEKI